MGEGATLPGTGVALVPRGAEGIAAGTSSSGVALDLVSGCAGASSPAAKPNDRLLPLIAEAPPCRTPSFPLTPNLSKADSPRWIVEAF